MRILALLACCLLVGQTAPSQAGDGKVDFLRQIRPILSDHCFQCHGPDEKQRKAELRLDTREGAFASLGEGFALVPGKLAESELWKRITSTDPKKVMPPPKAGKQLSVEQVGLIRRWIEEGAAWSSHWAFVPPRRPLLPTVGDRGWTRNPVDYFVLSKLEQEKLAPSPTSNRSTLLRRLSLDLIGLPPTREEALAFGQENDPTAYEKQVDRLLSSPHYGERWARNWLDAARYADSDGYEKDKMRQVWAYRDWVVASLNRNLPYDQFIHHQIAGDLLPNAGQDELVATGFLRNSMINEEGGVDPEQFRMEAMFDRMDAIGKSILGLTIQCAQCHSHKYDPFTHEDYYRLFAFLNNDHEGCVAVYTPEEQRKRADIFARIKGIESDLKHQTPDWRARMLDWEKRLPAQGSWTVIRPEVDDISTGGQKYLPLPDGSFLAQGYAPTKHRVKLTAKLGPMTIAALRLELLTDPNLPLGGPGRSTKGTGALTEIDIEAAPASEPKRITKLKIANATADISLPERPLDAQFDDRSGKKRVLGPISFAIDGKVETAWGFDAGPGRRNQPHEALFTLEKPLILDRETVLTVYLSQNHGGWNSDDNQNCNLGRLRLSVSSDLITQTDPLPPRIQEVLRIPVEDRSPAQQDALFSHWRTTVPAWSSANNAIEALWREHPEGSSQLVLSQRREMRPTHILARGDFLKPAKPTAPGVPSFLPPLPVGSRLDRLAFARWLTDREAPTTARAFVNRTWQSFFGIGLVSTSEDLGSQSESPSHPELLDWLATDLMENNWDVKRLHRTIVTSATYQQSSRVSPELYVRDPQNRLLGRGPRFRVDAEMVRDAALAISGLLDRRLGGPSVFPPAPAFLFQPPTSYGPKIWKEETGSLKNRRALYTFRYRSVPYPPLQNFDAPNGDFACVRRTRSNTPLQALTTLNEPLFLECAKQLAMRTLSEGGDTPASRLGWAFEACTSRPPDRDELAELTSLYDQQAGYLRQHGENIKELLPVGSLPRGVEPAEAAATALVCRVLLNLDETITKE